ncbi:hypothetical protein E7Z59_09310 [Robertkochia marina]|uniref:Aerotolerance regulator N-terminal domain-containing protein n=1 Tax=Robertkochia marina TaxID=1227945 RepID=A0A4S3M0Y1_9FLAO|nr:BatA domain-containing protein [Robertkochia marina]THD67838.1 hypothetical protein E7Z59_09310 [Robertkochia marina]TRZ42123.1 hypothetical protein D3A96_12405 [Robertkochia marina]
MHLKHPEILWALLLLFIPLIVHLFRLRRFKKEAFTNVRFLKEIELQTRKSATLKKLLVLLMRMLGIAMLVIAFAQPYSADNAQDDTTVDYTVYLDNSYSMQLPAPQGSLLQQAINQLLDNWPEDIPLKVITNDNDYGPAPKGELRNLLLGIDFTTRQLDLNEVLLKSAPASNMSQPRVLYVVSDLQQRMDPGTSIDPGNTDLRLIKLTPSQADNIAIDSMAVVDTDPENVTISVFLSSSNSADSKPVPVSVFSVDKLLARSTVTLNDQMATAQFTLKKDRLERARIEISDPGLDYDNRFYFNLPSDVKINVLHIGDSLPSYLSRIYTEDEFNLLSTPPNRIDYNTLGEQNLIILDQLPILPVILQRSLKEMSENGISILQIPSMQENRESWQSLNLAMGLPSRDSVVANEVLVNRINYDHPLLQGVFNDRVANFKYPVVKSYYTLNSRSQNILEFSGGVPFLYGSNGNYAFSASISPENSDLLSSALVVPVFYSLGLQSLKLPQPYFTLGKDEQADLRTPLEKDEILKVGSSENRFIPRQQNYSSFVTLFLDEQWKSTGHFDVLRSEEVIETFSINHSREESQLRYLEDTNFPELTTYKEIAAGFDQVKSENMVNELWKWFVIFAIAFFLTEMLILKYLK